MDEEGGNDKEEEDDDSIISIDLDDLEDIMDVEDELVEVQVKEERVYGIDDISCKLFEDKVFVVTGQFDKISRDQIQKFIEEKGGKVSGAVSGKTNYLIAGHVLEDGRKVETSMKYQKATKMGIKVLTEEGFEELVRRISGYSTFTFGNRDAVLEHIKTLDPTFNKKESPEVKKEIKEDAFGRDIRTEMWTDLYHPKTIHDLVGNKALIDTLFNWLRDWDDVHIRGKKKPMPKGYGGWQNAVRLNAKSVLVSGAPGIGKTSACRIICKHLGYEVLEMNASDCRSQIAIKAGI